MKYENKIPWILNMYNYIFNKFNIRLGNYLDEVIYFTNVYYDKNARYYFCNVFKFNCNTNKLNYVEF